MNEFRSWRSWAFYLTTKLRSLSSSRNMKSSFSFSFSFSFSCCFSYKLIMACMKLIDGLLVFISTSLGSRFILNPIA
jgi:hypothetical protein